MGAVITDSELTLDQLGDARRGPQIGSVAMRERPLEKQRKQASALFGTQFPRTAG
jgi:hypothetical protein